MSFSSRAKAELCRVPIKRRCCAVAEAYGALLYCSVFSTREIRIVTANDDFAERLPRLFRRAFSLDFDERPAEGARGKRRFLISDAGKIAAVYRAFGMEAAETLTLHINLGALENECCRASFVRGAFLAGGSVTDPAKSYHLELATTHASVSRELCSVLLELGFEPGQAMRGANYVTYMKQSEAIADFLTAVGAPVAALDVMSAKVERDMRNEINRKVNCDTANADKTVAAAQEQLAAIRAVEQEYGLDGLPEGLQQAALLRIANPEASLADLAMLSSPAVTKSCLSHRLKRLVELGRGIGKGD
ncbi:MAG: DNA-binding protein WhiA [Firmicutes bacterium]|nr:DNA-binding protein WhiA [Bacillota bacterium]